jgi:hypothetical protein
MDNGLMELWADDTLSEFAIIYDSRTVIRTKEQGQYTKMIDRSKFVEGYELNWGYTLSQWVVFYLANNYAKLLTGSNNNNNNNRSEFKLEEKLTDQIVHSDMEAGLSWLSRGEKARPRNVQPKATLKCHFCNLKYCLEEERMDHEQFWHSEKISAIR